MIKKTPATDYVHRVQEKTNEYIRELLDANASLRRHNASLESSITELRQERVQLKEEALKLREALEETRAERRELDRRLAQVEYENQEFSTRYVAVEQQNNNLVNLYAATNQLHSTLDREEILIILQEIVINLVGSEEFAVYVRDDESTRLELAAAMGISDDQARGGTKTRGLNEAVSHGELWIETGADRDENEPIACVPLRLDDRVIGVIAVYGLLVQKDDFDPVDYELFNLLASQAATALYASSLHAAATARAATSEAR